jgi:hypothetical protein
MLTPPAFVCPRRSKSSFPLARQLDGGRNNTSNEVRYVLKNAPIVDPKNSNQAFATNFIQPPPRPRRSQSVERQQATLDGNDERLLHAGKVTRATTTTRRGKELTHIPTPYDQPTQHRR